MDGADVDRASGADSPVRRSFPAARTWVRRWRWELAFATFVLLFAVVLRFTDTSNIQDQLLACGYLVVGRNPYAIFPVPAPPGLFGAFLPAFGTYLLTGYDFAAATYALKLENLAALVLAATLVVRVAQAQGTPASALRPLRLALLLSPLLFFVSFVWVEQDILGMAIALAALWVILRSSRTPFPGWSEAAGFALLAFAVFMYYFPALLLPTLLVYARNREQLVRRAVLAAATVGVFALWSLTYPGWSLASNAVGVTAASTVSIYSPFVLFGSQLFAAATPFQLTLAHAATVLFVIAEVVGPILLRWRGFSFATSVALAMTLPFLLLNILNGDEFVWPLPFLLVALAQTSPAFRSVGRLTLVQAYAIPMVVLTNLFDAPGPGTGTGIFYFAYPQFHWAVSLGDLLPHPLPVVQALTLASVIALTAGLVGLLFADRRARTRALRDARAGATPEVTGGPPALRPMGGIHRRFRAPGWRSWTAAVVVVVLVATGVSAAAPAPTIRFANGSAFPVGLFSSYPIANASSTYGFVPGTSAVTVAPSLGSPPPSGTVGNRIEFLRDIYDERFSLELTADAVAPIGFPYNATILELGSGALNLVRPFSPPVGLSPLTPVTEVNASPAGPLSSPQFVGPLVGARIYSGSSFAEVSGTPLAHSGGQLLLWFRASGTGPLQRVVATLSTGDVTIEAFSVGSQFFLGVLRSPAGSWSYSAPRTFDPTAWQQLTISNTSNGFAVDLDGIALPTPGPSAGPEGPITLLVGAPSTDPSYFDHFAFIGVIAGPYNTTGMPLSLGEPQLCATGFGPSSGSGTSCTPFVATPFSIRSTTGTEATVEYDGLSYTSALSGTAPELAFGRLSPIAPELQFAVVSFTTTTAESALPLVWAIDGALVAPAILLGRELVRGRFRRPG